MRWVNDVELDIKHSEHIHAVHSPAIKLLVVTQCLSARCHLDRGYFILSTRVSCHLPEDNLLASQLQQLLNSLRQT